MKGNYRGIDYEVIPYHTEELDGTATEFQGVVNDRVLGQLRVYGATESITCLEVQRAIDQAKWLKSTYTLLRHAVSDEHANRMLHVFKEGMRVDVELRETYERTIPVTAFPFTRPFQTGKLVGYASILEDDYSI